MAKNDQQLQAMRHTLAHILATAVQRLWPDAKFGVGPVVDNGFYYDIDLGNKSLGEEDFERIETQMYKIISEDQPLEHLKLPINKAVKWSKKARQPYKQELLNDLKRAGTTFAKDLDSDELGLDSAASKVGEVSFYKNGDFVDLCQGPHVSSTGKAGAFKLLRVSGAYWRGKEGNPQMQRVYGAAFDTKEELSRHLDALEQAKARDHRKLGQELDLFVLSPLVGSGLPLFTPRGTILRDELTKFSEELQQSAGYQRVTTPHIAKVDLYKKSGHYQKFPEKFTVTSYESDDELMMKPMNCPHHIQIFAAKPHSYRDLPVRYMETTMIYRDEKAGEIHGLSRVRAATQDDAHVFCALDQIETEFSLIMSMIKDMYKALGLEWTARLSFRDDSDAYLGDKDIWKFAQQKIEAVAKKLNVKYFIAEGEAAFYGPKIDILATDSLGREWQLATEQLDIVQPVRFDLKYVNQEGEYSRVYMIHKALLGSVERFLSVYIEHTAGKFPIWLAPEQVRLITVNQEAATVKFASTLIEIAKENGVRLSVDNDNESVGKKIRSAELMKVPYTVVIGEKEIKSGKLTPRIRSDIKVGSQENSYKLGEFLKSVANEAKNRTLKSTL